jgi:3-oxoacyl-[acyl-carrier protein] reductase
MLVCDLAGADVVADLATTEGRAALAEAAGPCDHLVVAHGIVRPKPIEETTEDDWDAILSVNAKSVYFLCKLFGPLLAEAARS